MPTPSTPVLFDGTTTTGLSANPLNSGGSMLTASGGVFGTGTYAEVWAPAPTWAGDGECGLTITTIGTGTGGGAFGGVIQQPSSLSNTADGYQVGYLWGASPKIEVYRYTNATGIATVFSQSVTALAAADAICIQPIGGTVYVMVRRSGTWSQLAAIGDTTYTFSGGGAVCEWAIYDPNGVCRIDDLFGGAVAAAGNAIALQAATAGSSSLSGSLRLAEPLTGSNAGASSTVGALQLADALTGQAPGTSATTADMALALAIAAASTATSTATGDLAARIAVTGSTTGTATTDATIRAAVALTGSTTGTANTSGDLAGTAAPALSGATTGTSTVTGVLAVARPLSGSTAGASTTAGTLIVTRSIGGSSAGSSAISGILDARWRLSGASSGASSAVADARGGWALDAQVAGSSTATAGLTVRGAVSAVGHIEGSSTASTSGEGNLAVTVAEDSAAVTLID